MSQLRFITALAVVLSGLCLAQAAAARFAPHNDLERQLQQVQSGKGNPADFLETLVDSQVILLSRRNTVLTGDFEHIPALILPNGKTGDKLLAVFTSAPLAARVSKTYPEYRYGVKTDFIWVLAHTAAGLGVVVNPGWTLSMTIPSYGLLQLRDKYRQRIDERLKQ